VAEARGVANTLHTWPQASGVTNSARVAAGQRRDVSDVSCARGRNQRRDLSCARGRSQRRDFRAAALHTWPKARGVTNPCARMAERSGT